MQLHPQLFTYILIAGIPCHAKCIKPRSEFRSPSYGTMESERNVEIVLHTNAMLMVTGRRLL